MKIEINRTDLGSPTDLAMFQRAFVLYLAMQGYEDLQYTLTFDHDIFSCVVESNIDDAQKNDLMYQLQTLKGVTAAHTDTGVQYVFTRI